MLQGITKNVKGGLKTSIAGIALSLGGGILGYTEKMEWTMAGAVIGTGVSLFLTPDPKTKTKGKIKDETEDELS